MANARIRQLASEIETLGSEDRLELLKRIVTPEMKLSLLVDDFSRRASGWNPEEIERDIDEAVQAVRRDRRHRHVA